jgi:uncharacterized SAM-binding protein YcdF (DUF218 family)
MIIPESAAFQFTKLIAGLMMPVSFVLILLAAGLGLLVLTRFQRAAKCIVAAGILLLFLASTPFVPELVLSGLERQYPVLEKAPADTGYIVVLGGGTRGGHNVSSAGRLTSSSLYRLIEGIRLAETCPGAMLVTSGGDFTGNTGSGQLMAQTAIKWGIAPERIMVLDTPLNTAREAAAAAKLINPGELVVLVTSGSHMPRSVMLFEKAGFQVIPAPTDFLVDPDRPEKHIGHQLPQPLYLEFTHRASWEYLGMLWAMLRPLPSPQGP